MNSFFEKIKLIVLLLLLVGCAAKKDDNSDLYDHPGNAVRPQPYFEKEPDYRRHGDRDNPYGVKKNHHYSDDYYVPPTNYDNNVNDNYGNIPRSGWDKMY